MSELPPLDVHRGSHTSYGALVAIAGELDMATVPRRERRARGLQPAVPPVTGS